MNRLVLIAGISVLVAAGAASAADLTAGMPPQSYPNGPCANPTRQYTAGSYIYRYCANRQNGYEAERDDWYKSIREIYRGSYLLDCDSDEGWYPLSMKTYFCP